MTSIKLTPEGYFLAHNCTVTGDVRIGESASFWFNAVVRGDVAPVTIGRRVNVQDGAVIHCDTGVANVIEDDVTIGHRAIVHGAFVGRGSLIGMGAMLLGETRIGNECLIAAGAVVPPRLLVPDRMMVMGVPAESPGRSRSRNLPICDGSASTTSNWRRNTSTENFNASIFDPVRHW